MNLDKYYKKDPDSGCWMHRSPLKLILNPILRKLQFWTREPLVICSNTIFDEDEVPHFQSYGLIRTRVLTAEEYKSKYK